MDRIRFSRSKGENNGGELVEYTLRTIDPDVCYKSVRASRGKHSKAEPISALYEQEYDRSTSQGDEGTGL